MPSQLLTALRDHLAGEGIARVPSVAGPLPPMWLEPRQGVPAPGEGTPPEVGASVVLGATVTGGIPPRPYESWQRRPIVDLTIRSTAAPAAHQLDEQIRGALIDRRNWLMGGLRVIESQVWREFQPLTFNEQAFTYVVAYVFQLYAS
jgi:hypothetical protein